VSLLDEKGSLTRAAIMSWPAVPAFGTLKEHGANWKGCRMGLTREDFALSDEELQKLNALVEATATKFHQDAPDEDPIDGMSVIFTFAPGFGRSIEIDLVGRRIDVS
jgi:hypothetical protein